VIADELPPLQRRAFEAGLPARAHVVLTHACNLACAHCYQAEHTGDALTTTELLDLWRQMADLGVTHLVLGGGEPLVRRDLCELVDAARRLGFATELYTNATLVDAPKARALKDAGLTQATVSLHGEAANHDALARMPGAFDRVLRGVGHLEAAGLRTVVRSTATRTNRRDLPLLALRFAGRALTSYGGASPHLYARDDGDDSPVRLHLREEEERDLERARVDAWGPDELRAELDYLAKARATPDAGHHPCQAARTAFALLPNGDVAPCTQTPTHVLGNVRRRTLADIWRDAPAAQRFRSLTLASFTGASPKCVDCRWRHVCARCPALSEEHAGTLTAWNPQTCQTTLVHWSEVERRAGELGLAVPA
jgi:radical SAM protein with 4Fe4S-binding SPASM domain